MAIEIKMPALSPTMEEGTLAKWLVKEGDTVRSGDVLAEIETDKATMEFEAVDEGTIARIAVAEGTDNVKVGTVIALLREEGEDAGDSTGAPAGSDTPQPADDQFRGSPDAGDPNKPADDVAARRSEPSGDEDHGLPADGTGSNITDPASAGPAPAPSPEAVRGAPADRPAHPGVSPPATDAIAPTTGDRIKASPLARRIAAELRVDLSTLTGSGPNGRIVKADVEAASTTNSAQVEAAEPVAPAPANQAAPIREPAPAPAPAPPGVPAETVKLSNMRRTIARRLTEAKQTVPHFYLTVDCVLDRLLSLRGELNAGLAPRGIKLSVNDLLVKALGVALETVPDANVQFAGDSLLKFGRADIAMAVAVPGGLVTPVIADAAAKPLSRIATEAQDLAARARDGKLKPEEYAGGTASISNLGMYGIRQFEAVINPPQGMILAVGAGEPRPWVIDGALGIATVLSATGSFDHRAIDGATGAELMRAFKQLVENPLTMLA